MIYLYHSFHAAEVELNIRADCKEGNRRNQDGINLTEIVFEGKN